MLKTKTILNLTNNCYINRKQALRMIEQCACKWVVEGKTMRSLSLKEIARHAALTAEREAISKVLEQTRWNRVKAAKLLKISYRALLYKIRDVGLQPERSAIRPGL